MEIKTVIAPWSESDMFDQTVNNLLATGWKLRKRYTLAGTADWPPHLFAELSRFPEDKSDNLLQTTNWSGL